MLFILFGNGQLLILCLWLPWLRSLTLLCAFNDYRVGHPWQSCDSICGMRKRERAHRAWTYGSTAIYISSTIILFILENSLLITSYSSLPKINQLEFASSLSHSAIIVQGSALRAAIGQLLQQTLSSRAHRQQKFLNARTLATQVCPIQFSNRPDVRWSTKDKRFSES